MASVISHIVYADRFLKNNPIIKDTQKFMLGVSFPDIRRISNVSRAQTHNNFDELDLRFEGMSAFDAGWKFHVWCDLRRAELLRDEGFFDIDIVKDSYYFSSYLLEDELVWGRYKNWETLDNYFRNAAFIDRFKELSESDWNFWFGVLAEYMKEKPNKETSLRYIKKNPSFSGKSQNILDEVELLRADKEVAAALESVHLKLF